MEEEEEEEEEEDTEKEREKERGQGMREKGRNMKMNVLQGRGLGREERVGINLVCTMKKWQEQGTKKDIRGTMSKINKIMKRINEEEEET